MFNADLMQFKDEMLKNLREMEKKIMVKVSKSQSDISTDINLINDSIKLLRDNNNSIIESMAEQKVNIDKITDFEKTLKKLHSTISGHENRISDSVSEISYIRNRCEKSLNETLSVPGIIGKNCKYSNFNEYIINNIKDITSLKTEKENTRKENRELKQKLEQSIKNLSNLLDSFINRSKLYTDSSKKLIIELMTGKINEIEEKNMEFMTKLCKIDLDTEQKIKEFGETMNDFSSKKKEQFEKMEENLLLINNNIEEMNKKLVTAKEELDLLKKNEKQYKNDIAELKNYFKNYFDNNNTYNNNFNNNSNFNNNQGYYNSSKNNKILKNFKDSNLFPFSSSINKSINKDNDNNSLNGFKRNNIYKGTFMSNSKIKNSKISLLLSDSNPKSNNNFNNNNIFNQINNNSTYNNYFINNQKNKNIELNSNKNNKDISDENLFQSDEMSQIDENEDLIKNTINKKIDLINKPSNISDADNNLDKNINSRSKKKNTTINPRNIFDNNQKYFSFDANPILEENNINENININTNKFKRRAFNLHKTFKGNKFYLDNNIFSPNKITSKINEIKEINEDKIIMGQDFDNQEQDPEPEPLILNKKIKQDTNIISANSNSNRKKKKNKLSHNSFPKIKNKRIQSQEIININNNNINNNLVFSDNEKIKIKKNLKKDIIGIDKETGAGCKIVKLSLDDNTITPYNTNGLLTIASRKYLNKNLIFVDESTPFDDIYLMKNINNMQQTCRNNSFPKKTNNYNKTASVFYNNNSPDKKDTKIEKNIEKVESKTINQGDAYNYGRVKFHFLKKN